MAWAFSIPFLGVAISGYGLDVLRAVCEGQEPVLPRWKQGFGDRLWRGVVITAIRFIYAAFLSLAAILASALLALFVQLSNPGVAVDHGQLTAIGRWVMLGFLILGFLAVTAAIPSITIWFALTGRFKSAFRLGRLVELVKRRPRDYLRIVLVSVILGAVLMGLNLAANSVVKRFGLESPWIVQLLLGGEAAVRPLTAVAGVYVVLVMSHLEGQYARLIRFSD